MKKIVWKDPVRDEMDEMVSLDEMLAQSGLSEYEINIMKGNGRKYFLKEETHREIKLKEVRKFMRCPDCNKFVPNGDPEVEVNGEDFEGEISFGKLVVRCNPEVRVMIPCGECGTELKETTLTFELEAEHECKYLPGDKEPNPDVEIEGEIEAEPIDDYKTKDRHGKPIIKHRYQAHLYGATVTATAHCPYCKEDIILEGSDSVDSSSMDELV